MNLLELQRENEALKLKLFWKEHNFQIMKNAICELNFAECGPACDCLACEVSGRYKKRYGEVCENKPCSFKPWFEQVLVEKDMSIRHGLPDEPIWVDGSVVDSYYVLDDDHHFINLGRQDWFRWTYGSKLWKATSVGDPELVKLERLLHYLDGLNEYRRIDEYRGIRHY